MTSYLFWKIRAIRVKSKQEIFRFAQNDRHNYSGQFVQFVSKPKGDFSHSFEMTSYLFWKIRAIRVKSGQEIFRFAQNDRHNYSGQFVQFVSILKRDFSRLLRKAQDRARNDKVIRYEISYCLLKIGHCLGLNSFPRK